MTILALRVAEDRDHENADKLRIYQFENDGARVQIVANKDNLYTVGDVVAVALENTVLEDGTLIKKNKYRGARSFGMTLGKTDKPVGTDLTAAYKATTVVKKVNEKTGVAPESAWTRYTSIDGYLKLRGDILAAPEVIATEKSHGSNFRVGYMGTEYLVGTHTSRVIPSRMDASTWPKGHLIKKALTWCDKVGMQGRVEKWRVAHPGTYQLGVFGELMGFKCSDLHYGWTDAGVRLFGEVQIDGKYLSYDDAVAVLVELFPEHDINTLLVPVLYRGKPDHNILKELRDRPSTLAAEKGVAQISEGIVIRANPEMYSEISHDRLIAKWKGPLYCERKSLRNKDPEELPVYLTAYDLIFDFVTAERIRHVWQRAQASGIPLHMKHIVQVSEMLFDDILKESKGEWPVDPEKMDRKVLVKWTKTIAADLIAMVMQDLQAGLH